MNVEVRGRTKGMAAFASVVEGGARVRIDSDCDPEFWVEVYLTKNQLEGLAIGVDWCRGCGEEEARCTCGEAITP